MQLGLPRQPGPDSPVPLGTTPFFSQGRNTAHPIHWDFRAAFGTGKRVTFGKLGLSRSPVRWGGPGRRLVLQDELSPRREGTWGASPGSAWGPVSFSSRSVRMKWADGKPGGLVNLGGRGRSEVSRKIRSDRNRMKFNSTERKGSHLGSNDKNVFSRPGACQLAVTEERPGLGAERRMATSHQHDGL